MTLVLLSFGMISCDTGTYVGKTNTPRDLRKTKPSAEGAKTSANALPLQGLDCPDEQRTVPATISVNVSETEQVFELTTLCKSSVDTEKMSSSKNPTDVIFVIDITGSMQGNINTIKNNLVAFAQAIEAKGWDARFGAVGFRDSVDAVQNLADAATIAQTLSRWNAFGGGDEQEFSQGGAVEAIKMFEADNATNPARANADRVVLLVTDNPGWSPETRSHNDFSTTSLEAAIQNVAISMPRIRFYHSTSRRPTNPALPISAHEQYNRVIQQTGVTGTDLNYPVTEDVFLNQFVEQFKPVKEKKEMNCRIETMTVKDLSGKVRSDVFSFDAKSPKQKIKITKDAIAKNSLAQLVGERCCATEGESAENCTQKVPFQIPIRIK